MTSVAALIGIGLSLYGGPFLVGADARAALLACEIIGYKAINVMRKAFGEMMDTSAPEATLRQVREVVRAHPELIEG